ncbi:MAG: phosphoenolpyruvate--protein phosphotransferase [Candidatus Thiodiazotropha sp. (ex Lucina aurantia)]|uniref:Phosphoenolpyruvate-protein phosphotransferase n=1 Tax=Candidatus Thiodiazotropha taylori TaxID=2792791 RepID=A0A9E4MWI8_9GAMM|nr:phosphoenolpyruvate--protein phosphotransferase [Candidatus Thiodiazotropha sp. (ex Lucina pensylvanica)]MBT3017122.1 phosphoenolpyruvate--protein phosphotransferase [Candidatus Thiodiazotropha taylori]MBT3040676.1 phosphoenolpyruvate--protein phosphotransferase [Candidatus Thiodiazotropha sp. (ex Codakia orbicularis)]MBV2104587.1 phosphoenolpyruvate--protein phosphotransferase [Candidatus Thiodiazotropha sp. (ex Lucina aurantia)]MCG7863242.1 phosphoenolpyruvate--protein phosphotransferase [
MTLSCQGIGINTSREVAIGDVYLLQQGIPEVTHREISEDLIQSEIERFENALHITSNHLRLVREQIPTNTALDISEFIDTHLLMLEDYAISQATINLIRENLFSAEWALQVRRDELVRVFDEMDDPYLRTRKDDVDHVVGQVQFVLAGGKPQQQSGLNGRIVVAKDLTPAETIMMKNQGVVAFVTEFGGPLSHTAILARSLGIPAVVGIHQATSLFRHGEQLVVDGAQGVVLADPTPRILDYYHQRIEERRLREEELRRRVDLPALTIDGEQIFLHANIELPEDIETTLNNRADGVGLFRTEFLFMNRPTPPMEEEQLEAYSEAVKGLGGIPLTIRTLDLGMDKTTGSITDSGCMPAINPALGLRAIRLCLKEPELFMPQLRAILRASAEGPVRLMLPMLSGIQELKQALRMIERTKEELRNADLPFDADIPIGGMIEVPAAALAADSFARHLDFLSIGTNDLIQYTLAVDRMDEEVNFLFDPLHPSVLLLIQLTIDAANRAGIPVSMCGEMAGEPRYARLLIGMGLRELSMQPSALLEARELVRQSSLSTLQERTAEFFRQLEASGDSGHFDSLFD